MSLERNIKKNNGKNKENFEEIIEEDNFESNIEKNIENNEDDRYVKNSVDYSSYELSQSECEGEDEILIDHENALNELALLGFFNDFALIDIGIHDLIREIYFED